MSFELAMKKAGIPLVRCFMHSVEEIVPYYVDVIIEGCQEIWLVELISHLN